METLKGMVYLYTETQRHYTYNCVYDNFEQAHAKAEAFVGKHDPVDGCSSEVRKSKSGEKYILARSTSFGERVASVLPVPFFINPETQRRMG